MYNGKEHYLNNNLLLKQIEIQETLFVIIYETPPPSQYSHISLYINI